MTQVFNRFSGINRLYGIDQSYRISQAHIAVVGIGGVGSWAVEAAIRSGFGAVTMVDMDDVCETNINRQLHSLESTVGQSKIAVMADRAREINPQCQINLIHDFVTPKTVAQIIGQVRPDVIIDAIDNMSSKAAMIAYCQQQSIAIVTVGAAAGLKDPTAILSRDLSQSFNDQLLRQVRKKLRQTFGFPRGDQAFGVEAVFSSEKSQQQSFVIESNGSSPQITRNLDCNSGLGSASFVTGAFGFAAVARSLNLLLD